MLLQYISVLEFNEFTISTLVQGMEYPTTSFHNPVQAKERFAHRLGYIANNLSLRVGT